MDTHAELKLLSYAELLKLTVAENQTYKIVSWPFTGKIETPRYGVYIYTKLK